MSLNEAFHAEPQAQASGPTPGTIWLCSLLTPPILSITVPFAIELLHVPMIDGFGNILWPGFFLLGVAGVIFAASRAPLRLGVKILAVCASIVFLLVACFLSIAIFFGVMMKL